MELINVLYGSEIILSILIVVAILLQEREGGLGSMFGGGGGGGEGYRSKRGMQLFLTRATAVMIVFFVVNSLAIALLNK